MDVEIEHPHVHPHFECGIHKPISPSTRSERQNKVCKLNNYPLSFFQIYIIYTSKFKMCSEMNYHITIIIAVVVVVYFFDFACFL